MRTVTLTIKPRETPNVSVEAECIIPSNFHDGGWKKLTVWEGNREMPLTSLFEVYVSGEAESPDDVEIVLQGDTLRTIKRIGEYMAGGKITVRGDIGMHCGNFMKGGIIEIEGNADGWLGREMEGGEIICRGNASHYCGAGYRGVTKGMKGGRLEVMGSCGDYCAECLAGGEIIIHGSAGDMTAVDMKGGKLEIFGGCTRACGNMKGGTVIVHGKVSGMQPAFQNEGTEIIDGRSYTVFSGDIANRGKGLLKAAEYEYY